LNCAVRERLGREHDRDVKRDYDCRDANESDFFVLHEFKLAEISAFSLVLFSDREAFELSIFLC